MRIRREKLELLEREDFDVYLDGGVRRGTDIIKALCAGAKGVALGRPFLFALSVYGPAGISRVYDILKDETTLGLKLLGVKSVAELGPQHLELLDSRLLGKSIS